jgi:hypothetical protein
MIEILDSDSFQAAYRVTESAADLAAQALGEEIPPEAMPAYCDRWGNFHKEPERIIEENHGLNFIKILIFEHNGLFFFGYQIKIEKLIRQKAANIKNANFETIDAARIGAREELKTVIFKTRSHGVKMQFANFVKVYYNQPELF